MRLVEDVGIDFFGGGHFFDTFFRLVDEFKFRCLTTNMFGFSPRIGGSELRAVGSEVLLAEVVGGDFVNLGRQNAQLGELRHDSLRRWRGAEQIDQHHVIFRNAVVFQNLKKVKRALSAEQNLSLQDRKTEAKITPTLTFRSC